MLNVSHVQMARDLPDTSHCAILPQSSGRIRLGHESAASLLLAGLGFVGVGTREKVRLASQRAIRVAELRGTIAQLDDSLATTARMAAMSGERRWSERFEDVAPKLDAAIAEANEIATSEISAALSETTGEAHRDLLTMERRALALSAAGDLATARTLLDSPEFGYLQEVYSDGLEVFGQELRTLADARAADLDARAWMEAGGLGLIAVLLVSTSLALRGRLRLRAALARTAAVACTDSLTDLPNRRQFYEELEAALSMGRRTGLDHALLLIDLDRLKAVNDAYGHPAGDELLRLAAARLCGILEDERRIARLGGDEFAFVLRCDPAGPDQPQTDPAARRRADHRRNGQAVRPDERIRPDRRQRRDRAHPPCKRQHRRPHSPGGRRPIQRQDRGPRLFPLLRTGHRRARSRTGPP